ncbi:MAG TPA: 1-deoxy-D-xylulose-5-phosphate reductoisomerase [Solirubrobacteraceae bacterium]|nr:1-deoxy-D-xylulose-5-phosphate reductoisomerase [Solirubrobacteraceae bacterium]
MSSSKRIVILGSSGSIGVQALAVIAASEELELVGLSARSNWEVVLAQAQRFGVTRVALSDEAAAAEAASAWPAGEVKAGAEGVIELIVESGADLVLNAIVGSAGLGPTIVVLGEGIDLALANKESLVVGGELVTALAEATGSRILPVDSEHAALHQLISAERSAGAGTIERLTLTASGGPFRGRSREQLAAVTAVEALAHPTWSMGDKITIDSATLMNKGLEVIEAHHLFGLPYERIDVIVHPQSIVHALVSLCDGAVLAHLGCPDMRVPIAYALHHPDRAELAVERLDLAKVASLTFEAPDLDAFPALRLAREAALAGGTAPCVLNGSNEVAVRAFLDGRIAFTRIAEVIEEALQQLGSQPLREFEALFDADRRAREVASAALA